MDQSGAGEPAGSWWCQGQDGEHSPRLAFFRAIREIAIEMAGRANARVVDITHTGSAQLPLQLAPNIHFVMARPNGRTDERGAIGGIRAEFLPHRRHGTAYDVSLCPFLAGVNQADGRRPAVDDKNRAAVCATND